MSDKSVLIFCISLAVFTLAVCVFAIRMSYEKYCIRTRKPFKSWINDGK